MARRFQRPRIRCAWRFCRCSVCWLCAFLQRWLTVSGQCGCSSSLTCSAIRRCFCICSCCSSQPTTGTSTSQRPLPALVCTCCTGGGLTDQQTMLPGIIMMTNPSKRTLYLPVSGGTSTATQGLLAVPLGLSWCCSFFTSSSRCSCCSRTLCKGTRRVRTMAKTATRPCPRVTAKWGMQAHPPDHVQKEKLTRTTRCMKLRPRLRRFLSAHYLSQCWK